MNKRLRKKLGVGEFDLLGFGLVAQFSFVLSVEHVNQFAFALIDFVERETQLMCGGSWGPAGVGMFFLKHTPGRRIPRSRAHYVMCDCTDLDRVLIKWWLLTQSIAPIQSIQVGPLVRSSIAEVPAVPMMPEEFVR